MKVLLPILHMQSAELQKVASKYTITEAEARKAAEANLAFANASTAIDKAWKDIAFAIEPVLTDLAVSLPVFIDLLRRDFEDLGKDGVKSVDSISLRIAALYDNIKDANSTFKNLFGISAGDAFGMTMGAGWKFLDSATTREGFGEASHKVKRHGQNWACYMVSLTRMRKQMTLAASVVQASRMTPSRSYRTRIRRRP
jgi:hypothetical protein